MSDSQRAVICPGPSFAGASLSGKHHLKTIHRVNRDFQNCTFLLEENSNACYVSKIMVNNHTKWARIISKRAKNVAWGEVHALHDLEVRGDCLELLLWFTSMPLPLSNTIRHSIGAWISFPDWLYRIVYHISQTDCIVFVIDKWEWVDFLGFSRC